MNRTCRICPKKFVPFRKNDENSGGSVSCNTQPNCRTSFTVATALLSPSFIGLLFGCSSTFLCGNDHLLPNLMPIPTRRIWCKYLSRSFCTVSFELPRWTPASEVLFSSTHFHVFVLVAQRMEQFLVLILHVVPETASVSSRTVSFCFPWIANSLSSFNTT